jgi:hypothetical protein
MKCVKCGGKGTLTSAGFDLDGKKILKEIECYLCEGTGEKGGYAAQTVTKIDELIALMKEIKDVLSK